MSQIRKEETEGALTYHTKKTEILYCTPRRHDHQKLKKDKKYKILETNKLSLLSQQKKFLKTFSMLADGLHLG